MPVSFKVVDNRTNISKKIQELNNQLENYGKFFLEGMANEIVLASPVDTGTYMESHSLGQTTPTGFNSSFGKPKKQPYDTYAQATLNRLYASIESLGGDWTTAKFSNIALHANEVEYEHGYGVYTMARDKAPLIAQEAAQRAKRV